jgi:hypothetical protein
MRPRSSIKQGLVLWALLGGLPHAWAAAPDRCQEDRACQEQTARAAQLASQTLYEEALTLYQSAYERINEPRLLLNLGRCHYRLGRARKALESYEAFQKAEPDPEPEVAARLAQFIAEAKLAIASDAKHPGGEPGATQNPSGATAPPVALVVPATAPAEEPAPTDGTAARGRTVLGRPLYRVALGASALGVGAVLLGVGIGALAVNGQCVTPSDTNPDQCAVVTHTDGVPYTRVLDGLTPGIPLLLIGVGLAAGGIALIAVPPRKAAASAGSRR